MSAQVVDVRPGARFAFSFLVTLGGVAYRMRLRWLPEPAAWTLIVQRPDRTPLTPDLIVRPGGRVFVPGLAGTLRWTGPEPYRREDLGVALRLVWEPA